MLPARTETDIFTLPYIYTEMRRFQRQI